MLVEDLERSRRFYVDILDLDLLMHEGGYLRVGGDGGFHIGMEEGRPELMGGPGIELVIQVDDVDAEYERLSSAELGVEFAGPPADQEWGGRHVWLTDPDGYRLSLYSI